MQLDKYQRKHKLWLRLLKEEHDLWQKIKDLPLIELSEPYQRGWRVKFELREDIARSPMGPVIQSILDDHMGGWVTQNVNHVRAIRQGKKTYEHKGKIIDLTPRAHRISEAKYEELTREQKKFFTLDIGSEDYRKRGYKRYYPTFPNYYLKLKARPNLITHKRQKGGELESELEQLKARIWYSAEFIEFQTNYGTSYPRHKDRTRTRDKIQKFKKGEIEDIYNEKVPREYDY